MFAVSRKIKLNGSTDQWWSILILCVYLEWLKQDVCLVLEKLENHLIQFTSFQTLESP